MEVDGTACAEHVWQLAGVALIPGHGAPTEYICARTGCDAVMYRPPGQPSPGTV